SKAFGGVLVRLTEPLENPILHENYFQKRYYYSGSFERRFDKIMEWLILRMGDLMRDIEQIPYLHKDYKINQTGKVFFQALEEILDKGLRNIPKDSKKGLLVQ